MARVTDQLERGRTAYAEQRWEDAFAALMRADASDPLDVDDLEMMAWSAALTGRDQQWLGLLERLYQVEHKAGRLAGAGRAAFWLGFRLVSLGEMGRAGGWFERSRRAIEALDGECATRGWLLLPVIHQHLMSGDDAPAQALAAEAAAIGERCGDRDLVAFARNLEGRALMRAGDVGAGLALVDEVMLSATSGELTPLVTGLVYCSVIASCHQLYALDRAREWTAALADWCDSQPQLVTFTGTCLVHRAEIMQIGGAWQEAAAEARRACDWCSDGADPEAVGDAWYQQAEIHRLRGELAAAEEAYRQASHCGREPQPGLALLRLLQGRPDAATAALQRLLVATSAPLTRARFLPAQVDVALALDDIDAARAAAQELRQIASRFGTDALNAMAAHAEGAVVLAAGDARAAIPLLQRAARLWQRMSAPYLTARIRVLIGQACGILGDDDSKRLEFDAASEVFAMLGAAPDQARLAALAGDGVAQHKFGLSPRELEVLQLVASGMTNRAIARQLHVSERTIDRHVSNILNKIEVSSRSAATAFAYEHGLV